MEGGAHLITTSYSLAECCVSCLDSFYNYFFFFLNMVSIILKNWGRVDLQCFKCTAKWSRFSFVIGYCKILTIGTSLAVQRLRLLFIAAYVGSIPSQGTKIPQAKQHSQKKKKPTGTSLVVQWLRLHTPNAGVRGLIPGQGTRSYVLQLRHGALKLIN